jgi:hypothetical protein
VDQGFPLSLSAALRSGGVRIRFPPKRASLPAASTASRCIREPILQDDWPTLGLNTLRWAKQQGAVTGAAHSGWGLQPVITDEGAPATNTNAAALALATNELPNYLIPPSMESAPTNISWMSPIWFQAPDGKPDTRDRLHFHRGHAVRMGTEHLVSYPQCWFRTASAVRRTFPASTATGSEWDAVT